YLPAHAGSSGGAALFPERARTRPGIVPSCAWHGILRVDAARGRPGGTRLRRRPQTDQGQRRTRLLARRAQRADQGAHRDAGPVLMVLGRSRSARLFARARGILPGGVDSPVRAFKAVGATPLFIDRGAGSRLRDVDGNRFIDYVMS